MNVTMRPFNFELDWVWINEALPIQQVEDTSGMVALSDNKPVGAMVMDNWTKNSVQAHFYLKNSIVLRSGFLEYCFDYVFNECGKKVMYALIPGNNEKAIKVNEHMGATEKCRFEEAFEDGVDYVIMELKRENCKYLVPREEAA